MVETMAIGLATFLAAILGWALNKLYDSLAAKIKIKAELDDIRGMSVDAKYSSGRTEESVKTLNLRVDSLDKNIKSLSATNTRAIEEMHKNKGKTDAFGKIITVLSKDYIKREKAGKKAP